MCSQLCIQRATWALMQAAQGAVGAACIAARQGPSNAARLPSVWVLACAGVRAPLRWDGMRCFAGGCMGRACV